jgi:gluconolactonase
MTCRARLAAALAFALAGAAGAATPPVPEGAPDAEIDLSTREGVALVGGAWRVHDARIVDAAFRSVGPDLKPSGPPNRTQDVEPRAGGADFDDSAWEVIEPETLSARRSSGRVSFEWYRIAVTIPERVAGLDPTGSTVVFETVVDDYAEVWVDGELPWALGQRGGSLVAGFNAPNRVVVARDARPGQRVQLAVFGINGPISLSPPNYVWVRSAKLQLYRDPGAAAPVPVETEVERLDPRLDAVVPPGARLERLAGGFAWVEGPVFDDATGALFFTDIPANAVFRWTPALGARLFLRPSGYSGAGPFRGREPGANGLALDAEGRLVLCEHGDRRVTRLEPDGTRTVLADRWRGRRLNSPNDVALRGGELWFTDPPFGLPGGFGDPARELPFAGVFRRTASGELTLATDALSAPNGLGFAPDGRTLYVSNADRTRPVWMAYPVGADGALGDGRVFADASAWVGRLPGVPDGLEVDAAGRVFAAGPGGVYVFAPDGAHLGTIRTGVATSNVAFGGGGADLYVTADRAVYRLRLAGSPAADASAAQPSSAGPAERAHARRTSRSSGESRASGWGGR